MSDSDRMLLSGNEAIAYAARDSGVALGAGYPGTLSTEILEVFAALGGPAQWSPNEKVALEVALGAAYGRGRALVAMKHVGLNVAADPLFTAAYTGVSAALVIVSADDPSMASSIGVGLGLRHVLPAEQARKVVSVIGDSTFVHSGITALVEMVYNPPSTGHVVIILDNGTTAMTGLQEHPATGRRLNHEPATRLSIEALARAIGVDEVTVIDPVAQRQRLRTLLEASLSNARLNVIVVRRSCLLAARRIRQHERAAAGEATE